MKSLSTLQGVRGKPAGVVLSVPCPVLGGFGNISRDLALPPHPVPSDSAQPPAGRGRVMVRDGHAGGPPTQRNSNSEDTFGNSGTLHYSMTLAFSRDLWF